MGSLLLTVEEFGRSIGVSRAAAYNLVKERRVRTVRVTPRGAIRVPAEAVREFIQTLEQVSPDGTAA
jgi:excisionase family DNA binding protein